MAILRALCRPKSQVQYSALMVIPKFDDWLPCYRHGTVWLSSALACAALLGIAARVSEGLGPLAAFFLALAVALSFLVLVGTSIFGGWRNRRNLRLALLALATPFVSLGVFVFVLWAVWRGWGVVPWSAGGPFDFVVDQTLPSPDGAWRAIYVEDLSGGPMTGVGEDVYLVHGTAKTLYFKDRVFSAECIRNLEMRWIGPRTLQISYAAVQFGDFPLEDGLLKPVPIPLFHDQQDEWKQVDPVEIVEMRRIVVNGSRC
jgi:hypothetical protein